MKEQKEWLGIIWEIPACIGFRVLGFGFGFRV